MSYFRVFAEPFYEAQIFRIDHRSPRAPFVGRGIRRWDEPLSIVGPFFAVLGFVAEGWAGLPRFRLEHDSLQTIWKRRRIKVDQKADA
jgi:hypothetical protein